MPMHLCWPHRQPEQISTAIYILIKYRLVPDHGIPVICHQGFGAVTVNNTYLIGYISLVF